MERLKHVSNPPRNGGDPESSSDCPVLTGNYERLAGADTFWECPDDRGSRTSGDGRTDD